MISAIVGGIVIVFGVFCLVLKAMFGMASRTVGRGVEYVAQLKPVHATKEYISNGVTHSMQEAEVELNKRVANMLAKHTATKSPAPISFE